MGGGEGAGRWRGVRGLRLSSIGDSDGRSPSLVQLFTSAAGKLLFIIGENAQSVVGTKSKNSVL